MRGIPADPVHYGGVAYEIGQANNALIYPGLGLGSIAVNSKLVTDEMISAYRPLIEAFAPC
ncbi:malic enzyme-like NAD(P)-binding protein [Mogibacterium timidum]|uniref:malic enzyme-like NAD(P)-binding protein n=1 Tax=Mogibacterium timidum TaxID=35519 RepID=UPI002ED13780